MESNSLSIEKIKRNKIIALNKVGLKFRICHEIHPFVQRYPHIFFDFAK